MKYKDQILKLRSEGVKPAEISNRLGCSIDYVYQVNPTLMKNRMFRPYNCDIDGQSNKNPLYRRWYKHSERGKWFSWHEFKTWMSKQTHCYITGRPINFDDRQSWHIDHIVPKSKGGSMGLENLAVSCYEANCAKWDMTLDELITFCREVLEHGGYTVYPPTKIPH